MTNKITQDKLIQEVKDFLKNNSVVQEMFSNFNVDVNAIDEIPISFCKLPVSAKTKNKEVFLNEGLLADGDFEDDIHYIVHETCHYLQQTSGEVRQDKKKEYLDKPTEVEAFQYQVKFMKDYYGNSEAEEYVDDLIEFHELSSNKAKEKKKQLLEG